MATKVIVQVDRCAGETVQCAVSAGTDYMYGDGRHSFNIGVTGGSNQALTVTKHGTGEKVKITASDKDLSVFIDNAKKPKTVKKGSSVSLTSKQKRVLVNEKPSA